ncbi:MAG: response regulator, partial [Clostridia bacterium]|nr:response regulator [Clostridia bacterium]
TLSLIGELPQIEEAEGFTRAKDALEWLNEHSADLAFLDIDMPGMSGMELAAIIKTKWPAMAIIFLTGYPQYAVSAFELRANGYILKPATKERLEEEIAYAFSGKRNQTHGHIVMKTFGGFECFVDGKELPFKQAKCKELLAYLVDRRGNSVMRAEAFAILWEDRLYDRSMQKQLDVIIRSLRATLQEYGIAAVLEMKDPGGNVMFESAETAGTDADRHIPALKEKLKALKSAGLGTIAAVSCFSDTEAALANPDMSVRVGEADGIVWLDNDARAWLNPFSEDARAYVLALVSEMAALGFDSVLLDNVCFSTEAGNGSPFYAGEGLYNGTRNQILRTFISDAVQACAGAQVLLMGNVAAFSEESDADNVRYDGNFLRIPAASLCLDARVSRQERQVTVGTETFRDIGSMADIFILSAAGYAVNAVKESGVSNPVTVCIDRPEDLAAAGAGLSGVEGLIIW